MTQTAFDLDAYAAALRGRSCEIIFTARSQSCWRLTQCRLHKVTIEFRVEGGAAVVGNVNSGQAVTIAVLSAAAPKGDLFNGQRIRPFDLIVIPPGQKIIETSSGPRQWISCALSPADLPLFDPSVQIAFGAIQELKRCVVLRSPTLAKLIAAAAADIERLTQSSGPSQEQIEECERALVEALSTAASAARERSVAARDPLRGRRARSYDHAYNALRTFYGSEIVRNHVADFCGELGATERQLRRSFRAFFGMGPNRLAKIYRVNRVRRMLVENGGQSNTITKILAACKIAEPGRFAGEYRALFDETPSETRRRLQVLYREQALVRQQPVAKVAAR